MLPEYDQVPDTEVPASPSSCVTMLPAGWAAMLAFMFAQVAVLSLQGWVTRRASIATSKPHAWWVCE